MHLLRLSALQGRRDRDSISIDVRERSQPGRLLELCERERAVSGAAVLAAATTSGWSAAVPSAHLLSLSLFHTKKIQ